MTPNPNRAKHLTQEMREKAGATKRARLEEEFGLPFERARKLRLKYYTAGYGACREKTRGMVEENKMLRERIEALQRVIEELRSRSRAA